jgi:hypothetical protein
VEDGSHLLARDVCKPTRLAFGRCRALDASAVHSRKLVAAWSGMRWKMLEKKEGNKKMALEGVEEGSIVPLELLNGVMEQVEVMVKKLRKISGWIKALVEGIRRLTEAVEGLGRKEVEKVNKDTEMEDVQKVDKQTEMEQKAEDSEGKEKSEEEEAKEEKEDNGKEDEDEDEEESDGMEDEEEGEEK